MFLKYCLATSLNLILNGLFRELTPNYLKKSQDTTCLIVNIFLMSHGIQTAFPMISINTKGLNGKCPYSTIPIHNSLSKGRGYLWQNLSQQSIWVPDALTPIQRVKITSECNATYFTNKDKKCKQFILLSIKNKQTNKNFVYLNLETILGTSNRWKGHLLHLALETPIFCLWSWNNY